MLLDTNVLIRLANKADPQRSVARVAVSKLRSAGELLQITPQNLIEFLVVATRPRQLNGLGLGITEVEAIATGFEKRFSLLEDSPSTYLAWKQLVAAAQVIGKRVHDARLVAVCHVHGVDKLLTFNVRDFAGLGTVAPGVVVLDPASV